MVMPSQLPPARRRVPRAVRESQMIAVAEEIFAERGYLRASMDEIADRVGVSKPMLYEYFGSKQGLLVACVRRARAHLMAATEAATRHADTPEQALRESLLAYFRFARAHHRSWAMLRGETAVVGFAAAEEIEVIRRQQVEQLGALLAAHVPATTALNPQAVAETIVGGCERLALWCEQHPDTTPEQAAELVLRLTWFGIAGMTEVAG